MEKSPEAKEILLISVRNDIQAALVENLLKEQNIYCAKRHVSVGAVAAIYTGMSNLGVDIYVNEKDYETAKEIIKVYDSMVSEEDLERQALEKADPPEAAQDYEEKLPEEDKETNIRTLMIYKLAPILFLLLVLLLLLRVLR